MTGDVERRRIVGSARQERIAVVLIPLPVGGEVEIDRTWRMVGWLRKHRNGAGRSRLTVEHPRRYLVQEDGEIVPDDE